MQLGWRVRLERDLAGGEAHIQGMETVHACMDRLLDRRVITQQGLILDRRHDRAQFALRTHIELLLGAFGKRQWFGAQRNGKQHSRLPRRRRNALDMGLHAETAEPLRDADGQRPPIAVLGQLTRARLDLTEGNVVPVRAFLQKIVDRSIAEQPGASTVRPQDMVQAGAEQDDGFAARESVSDPFMDGNIDEGILDCGHDDTCNAPGCRKYGV